MGTKYATILVGGVVQTYNDNPPSDDGSQTEANRVKYVTITDDLSAPLHSAITRMDAKILDQVDEGPTATATTYTSDAADHNTVLECSGTFTLSLLNPTGNVGYKVTAKNAGSGAITVDVSGGANVDGAASVSLGAGEARTFYVNAAGTAYYSITGNAAAGFGSGTAMVFYQDAAPAGWTIDATVDEHTIRLTKGSAAAGQAGGTTGGTNNFSTQFANLAEGATPGVGSHAVSVAEMPSHNHGGGNHAHGLNFNSGSAGNAQFLTNNYFGLRTSNAGNMTIASATAVNTVLIAASGATVATQGSGTGHSHTIDLRVKWAACIVATKD